MLNRQKELQAFYESPKFFEIARFVLAQDKPVSQDELLYRPERYPFTAHEFSQFCHSLFLVHEKDIAENLSGEFPECSVTAMGVKITLLIGQGSCFFAKKADAPSPAPEGPSLG